ncbi:hypothetical protein [Streptomyces sp. NPDC058664]|uniref:hypothetical protein n=1 Tax=unclassified Streptomyces TaxID=2593676 RepID=UPI003664FBDE
MRHDLETAEISDADLDAVSGGLVTISGGLAGALTSDVTNVLGTVGSLQTVQGVEGLVAGVPGLASGITGVSVNTAGIAGI